MYNDTKISIPQYRLDEILNMEIGDCIEMFDDHGILGYLEKIPEDFVQISNITIEGKKYSFNYYFPKKVEVRWY